MEESLKYKEESSGRENKIKQVEDVLDKERQERRHIKLKLDEESRLSRVSLFASFTYLSHFKYSE